MPLAKGIQVPESYMHSIQQLVMDTARILPHSFLLMFQTPESDKDLETPIYEPENWF